MTWGVKISNFIVLGVTQNGPLLAKKWDFWAKKKFHIFFSESSFQNLMFDTKTNLLSFVDAKIWSFKNWPKMTKFKTPTTLPLGVLEQKDFGFPSFSIGDTSTPKMIKIDKIIFFFSVKRHFWLFLTHLRVCRGPPGNSRDI